MLSIRYYDLLDHTHNGDPAFPEASALFGTDFHLSYHFKNPYYDVSFLSLFNLLFVI